MTSIMSKQQRGGWSDLQTELLELILQRLTLMDYLNCREVCSSWRTAVNDALATKRRCPPAPQFPFLLLLPDVPNCPASLLNLNQYRLYTLATKFHRGDWVASVGGWFIIQSMYYEPWLGHYYVLLRFYNPVSRAKFMLPKLSLFSVRDLKERTFPSSKVVVSSELDCQKLLVVISVLIKCEHQLKQQLSFCKVKDKSWTLIQTKESRTMIFTDIAIHGCKLYAITEDGSSEFVIIFNLINPNAITAERLVMLEPKPNRIIPHFEVKSGLMHCTDLERSFIVIDSTCGELLLVLSSVDKIVKPGFGEYVIWIKGFRVFKLDRRGPRWLEVDSLGHRFLLLDAVGIQIISATNLNGPWKLIQGNCVYFCVSNTLFINSFPKRDVGVFSLADKSIRHFPLNSSLQVSGRNLWFMPSPW